MSTSPKIHEQISWGKVAVVFIHAITDDSKYKISSRNRVCTLSKEYFEDLAKEITPIVEKTGFFEFTNFQSLELCTIYGEPEKVDNKIFFKILKKEKRLSVSTYAFWHDIESFYTRTDAEMKKAWARTELLSGCQMMLSVCEKYKLQKASVEEYIESHPRSMLFVEKEKASLSNVTLKDSSESDFVEVCLQAEFTGHNSIEELTNNLNRAYALESSAEKYLKKYDAGYIEGHEVGNGRISIFCKGNDPKKLIQILELFAQEEKIKNTDLMFRII